MPDYDEDSFGTTRQAVLTLAAGVRSADSMFGPRATSIRSSICSARPPGGAEPANEAIYRVVTAGRHDGRYESRRKDVPVDGFWSITVYNKSGYFEKNPSGAYSVNNITGDPDPNGSVTVQFGGHDSMRRTRCRSRTDGTMPSALPATFRDPRRHLEVPRRDRDLTGALNHQQAAPNTLVEDLTEGVAGFSGIRTIWLRRRGSAHSVVAGAFRVRRERVRHIAGSRQSRPMRIVEPRSAI